MQPSPKQLSAPGSILKILLPLSLTASAIVYCWVQLLSTALVAQWQHYAALAGFLVVVVLLIKNRRWATIGLGIYLLLAITTLFSLNDDIAYSGFGIGPLTIPIGNLLAWGIFIVYIAFNATALGNYYLDYRENKGTL